MYLTIDDKITNTLLGIFEKDDNLTIYIESVSKISYSKDNLSDL
jgi:hypothetical protein